MKKLVFSLAIVIGLLFCSTHAFAQGVQQYEYGTVCIIATKAAIFIKPDKTIETYEIKEWTPAEIRSGNNGILDMYAGLNDVLNKKAKDGWELVNTTTILNTSGWTLRRPIKR